MKTPFSCAWVLALTLAGSSLCPLVGQVSQLSDDRSAVKDLAAAAFAAGNALYGAYAPRDSTRRRVFVAPRTDLPIQPAWVATDGVHPPWFLLVGKCEGRLIPLGGFDHPDLGAATPCVTSDSAGDAHLRDLARQYTVLVDRGGGYNSFGLELVSDSLNPVARMSWEEKRPVHWPSDSVYHSASDETFVTLTRFTWLVRGALGAYWQPTAYTFVFRGGRLHSWMQREGPILPYRPGRERPIRP